MLVFSVIMVAVYAEEESTKCPSTGAFEGLQCYAHTAKGIECEKHMWLAKCLGKNIPACRKCGKGFTARCSKPTLRNLCHFHYSGPTGTAGQKRNSKHVATILAAAADNTAQDDDTIDMTTSREAILKKLAHMKAEIQANVDHIEEKQQRKADKNALGIHAKKSKSPTVVPTLQPTTVLEKQYWKAHSSKSKSSSKLGSSIWDMVSPKADLDTAIKRVDHVPAGEMLYNCL